jgi:copper(I)-binding protein
LFAPGTARVPQTCLVFARIIRMLVLWPSRFFLRAQRYAALARHAPLLVMMVAFAAGLACRASAQTESYQLGDLIIQAPWARATPAGAKVGGAYLKITNKGTQPDRLVGGSLTGARGVEVHEMSMSNNVMKMRHLKDGLEIKPGQTVELKPGGYHLMLTGLSDGLKQGQKVKGSLSFEKAGTVEVEYSVAPVGAASGGHTH